MTPVKENNDFLVPHSIEMEIYKSSDKNYNYLFKGSSVAFIRTQIFNTMKSRK